MTPSTTRQACAHESGRKAAKAFKSKKANPHKKGTVDHQWWDIGFEGAFAP